MSRSLQHLKTHCGRETRTEDHTPTPQLPEENKNKIALDRIDLGRKEGDEQPLKKE